MSQLAELPIADIIVVEGHNPRTGMDPEALQSLAASVKERGVIVPLEVVESVDQPGKYELVAGHRRHAAAQLAKQTTVPVFVKNGEVQADPAERLVDAIVENVQREDLSPYDEGKGYAALREQGYTKPAAIAKKVSVSATRVKQRLAIFDLGEEVGRKVGVTIHLSSVNSLAAIRKVSDYVFSEVARKLSENPSMGGIFASDPARIFAGFRYSADFCVSKTSTIPTEEVQPFLSDKANEHLAQCISAEGSWAWQSLQWRDVDVDAFKASGRTLFDDKVVVDHELIVDRAQLLLAAKSKDARKKLKERNEREANSQPERETRAEQEKAAKAERAGVPVEVLDKLTDKQVENRIRLKEQTQAQALNDQVAAKLLQADVKISDQVLRMLAYFVLNIGGSEWLLRGLRYLHPRLRTTHPPKKEGDPGKITYVEAGRAHLTAWIDESKDTNELLQRVVVLLLSAVAADPRAVAQSNRKGGSLPVVSSASPLGTAEATWGCLRGLLLDVLGQDLYDRTLEEFKDASFGYAALVDPKDVALPHDAPGIELIDRDKYAGSIAEPPKTRPMTDEEVEKAVAEARASLDEEGLDGDDLEAALDEYRAELSGVEVPE